MKKLSIILAMIIFAPIAVAADQANVDYETPYYTQGNVIPGKKVQYAEKNSQVYKKSSGNDYILKYNIDDLESAPWLNNGKRNYK